VIITSDNVSERWWENYPSADSEKRTADHVT
jgi:hypothetical protein